MAGKLRAVAVLSNMSEGILRALTKVRLRPPGGRQEREGRQRAVDGRADWLGVSGRRQKRGAVGGEGAGGEGRVGE